MRFIRWILLAVVVFVALTAVPVLLMRWWSPFSSAFMLDASIVHSAEKDYATRYSWVDLEKISPNAVITV